MYDGHGSVRALTDTTGAVTDTYDYDAFGNIVHSTGTTPNVYLYSGEQFDPDLHLYYNRARYLNVTTGRFWIPDSFEGVDFEPETLHHYVYVSNGPVDKFDPSGNEELTVPGQLTAGTVALVLASATVLTLAYLCVAYAAVGKGGGPCGTNQQKQGRMRIQLQLGDKYTAPITPVLLNRDPPGVTSLQVRNGLATLYAAARTATARFPFNNLDSELVTAIIIVSQQAGTFAPLGYGLFKRGLLSAPIGDSGWRIDVDNLEGTNLRQ